MIQPLATFRQADPLWRATARPVAPVRKAAPIEQAKRWWLANDKSGIPFETILGGHLKYGYVYTGPDAFVLARPWRIDALDRAIELATPIADPDCWFVWLAAGRLDRFVDLAPHSLPYLAWHRRGEPKVWAWPQFKRKMKSHGNHY